VARVLVDGDEPVRSALRTVLRLDDQEVSEADGGAEALRLARSLPFHRVRCDLFMPG
jgi:CheY-like chemotaxis protein